jgi:hypothetical protein
MMADDDALTVTGEAHLADRACWDSLESGDAIAFARLSAAGWDMRLFGVCAGLLDGG